MTQAFSTVSFLAGIAIGIVVTSAWFSSNDTFNLFTPEPPKEATTTTQMVTIPSGAVSVADQSSGDTVIVESVTVPPPGVWVAVREVNGTDMGNVLGAAHVSGPRSNVHVPLLRATEPNKQYAVELYRDDASTTFDVTRNSVYVDFDTGNRAVSYFTTTN